jgi:hypothetical protein
MLRQNGWWQMLIAASLCVFTAACERSVMGPSAGGLTVASASANLAPTKDTVVALLTLKNFGDTATTIYYSTCTTGGGLSVRAYREGGSPLPAWDSGLQRTGVCDSPDLITLQPGESHLFTQKHHVAQILGDSLPSGSYRFTVSALYFRPSLPTEMGTASLSLQR